MKGIFFSDKDDIGMGKKPIDIAHSELLRNNYEIRRNMPHSNKPYSKYFLDDNTFEVGGVVKTKKGITNDGKDGGYFEGRPHSQGGIKAVNVDTNTPIEVEGGEVVITKSAVADTTKRDFMGKKMTNKEILSYINQSGGGVALEKGGHIMMQDGGEVSENAQIEKAFQEEFDKITLKEFDTMPSTKDRLNAQIEETENKIKSILELLYLRKGRIKLTLSVISKSIDTERYDKEVKELRQVSDLIAKYEMALKMNAYTVKKTFWDSLNETGNAFNVRISDRPSDPKLISEPFNSAIYTDNFKLWFGDWELAKETKNYVGVSKAIDSNGYPEIYFHGGRQYQTRYKPYDNISVFYWAQNYEYAEWFAWNSLNSLDNDSVVLRAYIDCKNPIDLTPFGSRVVDLGDLIRYVIAFYPQTNLTKFLPVKYREQLREKKPFGIKIRAWQLIRQFNPWVKNVRDAGIFDGFMYEENNPSHILNGREHTTKAFAIFDGTQVKFPNQYGFNKFLQDFRFDEGGILI